MAFFREQASALNLFQQHREPNRGFRPGQLGALHAVLAHFSVQDAPVTIRKISQKVLFPGIS